MNLMLWGSVGEKYPLSDSIHAVANNPGVSDLILDTFKSHSQSSVVVICMMILVNFTTSQITIQFVRGGRNCTSTTVVFLYKHL